jgi:hypothetical protein
MSSVSPLTEGTISGAYPNSIAGRISGGGNGSPATGSVSGESAESAAVAELGNLIASLGSLASQAQSLPLTPPTLPGLPQDGYRPQATDYTQLSDDSN